ncbi:YndM family protein [Bacillus sp. FSL K6-3431]|uniref:YndM family protein n=1 Tax=Bacillus sp. FSL K6-3431 TaxID=2921500 RepID=UPI0030F895AC
MKHIKALALKFISSLVLLYIILGAIYGLNFGNVFLITLVLGIVSYLIGDLFILPRTNNMTATIADFGLALIVIWLVTANVTVDRNTFAISLVSAIAVALFELFFHKYLAKGEMEDTQSDVGRTESFQYQTETSQELAPENDDFKEEKNDDEI